MRPADFDPRSLAPGSKTTLTLDVAPLAEGGHLELSLLAARGAQPGQTLVLLGGVHGDEYEGMAAARAVFAGLDPAELQGTLLGIPLCNPLAFAAASRTTPHDGLNLARVFPGRPDGSLTERLAHAISIGANRYADFLIDLHSSGTYIAMPLLIGCYSADNPAGRLSTAAAHRFGLPLIWYHGDSESNSQGRSLSEPHARGVPWLYTESPSGGWLHAEVAALYARGVLNVMRYLQMLPGEAPEIPPERVLMGEGDIDTSITAPAGGFLSPRVSLLEDVTEGQLLGVIEGPAGEELAEIRAPFGGTVVLTRNSPPVAAGEIVFLLT